MKLRRRMNHHAKNTLFRNSAWTNRFGGQTRDLKFGLVALNWDATLPRQPCRFAMDRTPSVEEKISLAPGARGYHSLGWPNVEKNSEPTLSRHPYENRARY